MSSKSSAKLNVNINMCKSKCKKTGKKKCKYKKSNRKRSVRPQQLMQFSNNFMSTTTGILPQNPNTGGMINPNRQPQQQMPRASNQLAGCSTS